MHAMKRLRNVAAAVLVSITLTFLTGCSSLLMNSDAQSSGQCSDPYIYGGTIVDTWLFFHGVASLPKQPLGALALLTYSTIDLPLSLAADTLVLPITVYKTLSRC